MIQCKKLVPDVYAESEDYLCILRLLDLISNVEKNRNGFVRMRDPFLCPEEYLPLLAECVGYKYDKTLTVNDNRLIIEAYPFMRKNKGTKMGLELAIKTALALSDTYATVTGGKTSFVYQIDNINRTIDIQIKCLKYSKKLMDLIEYVRPIGFFVDVDIATSAEVEGSIVTAQSIFEYIRPTVHLDPYVASSNSYINGNNWIYEIGINMPNDITALPTTVSIRTKLIINTTSSEDVDDVVITEDTDDVVITKTGTTTTVTKADDESTYNKIDSISITVEPASLTGKKQFTIKLSIPNNQRNTPKELFGGIVDYTINDDTYSEPIQRMLYNEQY